jgi:PAS domain-containing protein
MSPQLAGRLLHWSTCPDVRKRLSWVYLCFAVTLWFALGWYLVRLQADHTSQKKLTEILVQSLNDSQTAVLAVSPDQTVVLANPVAVKFFGKDPSGTDFAKLWPEKFREDFVDIYEQAVKSATSSEAPTVRLDGTLLTKEGPVEAHLVLRPAAHGNEAAMVVTVVPMFKAPAIQVESSHSRAQRSQPRNIFQDASPRTIGE